MGASVNVPGAPTKHVAKPVRHSLPEDRDCRCMLISGAGEQSTNKFREVLSATPRGATVSDASCVGIWFRSASQRDGSAANTTPVTMTLACFSMDQGAGVEAGLHCLPEEGGGARLVMHPGDGVFGQEHAGEGSIIADRVRGGEQGEGTGANARVRLNVRLPGFLGHLHARTRVA